ncbi:MAG: hypothetical protein V2A69_06415 [Pseudomonadota bacterium]
MLLMEMNCGIIVGIKGSESAVTSVTTGGRIGLEPDARKPIGLAE